MKYLSKKGGVFQIFVVLIILTVVAIVGFICLALTWNVLQFWDTHSDIMPVNSTAYNANQILLQTGPKTTDYAVFFLFLGLNIGVIVSAVRTKFSGVLIFIFILSTILAIMIAAGMVNIYQGMSHMIPDVQSQLTLTNYVFSKYTPLIMCIISALVIIIMLGKSGGDINN